MVELEAIDMSLSEEEIIPKLMNNLRNVGFLTLSNIEGYDEGEHFNAVQAFYKDIPQDDRDRMIWRHHRPQNTNYYRGIAPFVNNNKAHKEFYDMGGSLSLVSDEALRYPLYEKSPFPEQEEVQWIKLTYEKYYNLFHSVSLKLLEYMAIGLGKDREFFHQWF